LKEQILDNTYRLLEEIGRGGFGAVYRAVRLGAEGSGPVAIKFLNRGSLPLLHEQIRFQREATLMSQLLHPGTVTVYELGESEGRAYIVMEYVDGPNLRDYVRTRGGRLPLADILEILIQSAEALEYVHGHSIVHRDIKPQNILVANVKEANESRIQLKIVDFGVARLGDPVRQGNDSGRPRTEVVGTFNYMAPESTGLVNWGIDARADIYSLGIVAYELVTGRTPFHDLRNEELLWAHVEKSPPAFSQFDGPRYHELLESIIIKCIEKRPENRYQSMFGLLSDLKRLLNDLRIHGRVVDVFEIATKDVPLTQIFNNIFVGRGELIEQVVKNINFRAKKSRVTWGLIRSTVGLGRTRCLAEVRHQLDEQKVPYLHVRFTESEQRLSLRALSLAVNEQLQALEAKSPNIFQNLMHDMAMIAGSGATDVARLIPALRPHLMKVSQGQSSEVRHTADRTSSEFQDDETVEDSLSVASEMLERNQIVRKKIPTVRAPIQQVFLELLAKIAQQTGFLVFLLDDVHLADPASLGLFQFIAERVNDSASFAFVMTLREGSSRQNFVLDNFMLRLSSLRRRFQVWDLSPLSQYEFQLFLQAAGVPRPSPKFVEFVTAKCDGSPLLLHVLLKRMVETEALVPERKDFKPWEPVFRVDWEKLSRLVVDYRNIEALLASLERLDKWDQKLTTIAAVSHEPCEFEYFRVEHDFTSVELETRLLSLVRRGVFEILGDDNIPVQRRSFAFSHEKLRAAVLSGLEMQARRQIHLALANRIIVLYPRLRKEQVLSLAKHFEGAGTLADAERSSTVFLKAARIHARSFEHSLAKYYSERAMARASSIGNQQERLNRLREAFETEYMIHIAQNELVAASDVCQQLVALTFEPQRKETLQVHWGQLLLGIGRHNLAFSQIRDAIDRRLLLPFSKFHAFLSRLWQQIGDGGFFSAGLRILQMSFLRAPRPSDNHVQALMLLVLAQAHGVQTRSSVYLAASIRFGLHKRGPTRALAVFNMMIAAQLLRAGKIDRAFEIAETLERTMESNGRVDISRWVRALRAIWLDYPMGRMERLGRILDERKDGQMPVAGVMNIESHALRCWIRACSPRIWKQAPRETRFGDETRKKQANERIMHAGTGYVADRVGQARKLDAARVTTIKSDNPKNKAPLTMITELRGKAFDDRAASGKYSRRIREAGENGSYLGLMLFSDAIRYALADRLDPLRRTVDQFSRQRKGTVDGEIFKCFSMSIQDIALGQLKEALEKYILAMKFLLGKQEFETSLPVTDAMRMGVLMLPMMAYSMGGRGWIWGRAFARLLERTDRHLLKAEGKNNPKRTAVNPLFQAMICLMKDEKHKALKLLGEAKVNANSNQNDLVALFAEQALGLSCSQVDQVRSMDNFAECYRRAHELGWKMLERQLLSLCRRLKLPLQHQFPELLAESEKINFRRRSSGAILSYVMESWLVMSRESQTANYYISQAPRVAARLLLSPLSALFKRQVDGKALLKPAVRWVDDGRLFLQNLSEKPLDTQFLETELVRNLPRFYDDPIRLVPTEGTQTAFNIQHWSTESSVSETGSEKDAVLEFGMASETTEAGIGTESTKTRRWDAGRTQLIKADAERGQADLPYAIYAALKHQDEFFGWLALSRVSVSQFATKDMEFDLLLLARHIAFTMMCESKASDSLNRNTQTKPATQILSARELALPNGMIEERIGRVRMSDNKGFVLHAIDQHKLLGVLWSFEVSKGGNDLEMGGLFRHYLSLFVEALRDNPESMPLDRFAHKFSADVGGILERTAVSQRYDRIAVNAVFIDLQAQMAQECVFGAEQMAFAGLSKVERELLLELNGVLRLDRLVYRERRRIFGSSQFAWLMSHDPRLREVFPQFSRGGFVDEFFGQKHNRGMSLSRVLNASGLPDDFSGHALLFDGTNSISKNVA
jgi:serine/threonine protein kinase